MPGYILHQGAQIICLHGGNAMPTTASPQVFVSGMPITTQVPLYSIIGCPQSPPAGPPCVTAQWTTAALRVRSNGDAVLLFDSQATTTPNGVPLTIQSTQSKVLAE